MHTLAQSWELYKRTWALSKNGTEKIYLNPMTQDVNLIQVNFLRYWNAN